MGSLACSSAADARAAASRAARALARDARVRLVYLFGSASDRSSVPVRDIDIAVLTNPRLSLEELLDLRADVVAAVGAPIDLVSLNDAAIVLAWEVANSGECLYAKDPNDEATFVTRARARYWDFSPFRKLQWEFAGRRIEERGGSST